MALVAVEAMRVLEKPFRVGVAMFVHDVGVECAQFRPEEIETIIRRRRPGTGDELNLRMLLLERLREPRVTLNVLRSPLLVADPRISC
jgi:hypothetical protein